MVADDDDGDSDLSIQYTSEILQYSTPATSANPPLEIKVKLAASTRGRNIISNDEDNTGIFIWPASHLMCYYLNSLSIVATACETTQSSFSEVKQSLGKACELGCGVGLVGIAAVLSGSASECLCTDGDANTLNLAQVNIDQNIPEQLKLKDIIRTQVILFGAAVSETQQHAFDTVLGADIIYPSMSDEVLVLLFQSVNKLLKNDNGARFVLSFVSRDGHITSQRLIQAASDAKFSIDFLADESTLFGEGSLSFSPDRPPMMGAKVFALHRDVNAEILNGRLGGPQCKSFPGLKQRILRAAEEESSEEEWEAPFTCTSSTDEE